jgi:hypothetical protein
MFTRIIIGVVGGIIGFRNRDRLYQKYNFDKNPEHRRIFEKYEENGHKDIHDKILCSKKTDINWVRLSSDPNLSLKFIDKYKNDVYWYNILSQYTYDRRLTNQQYEWWINKYKRKIEWKYVSYKKLSPEFISNHKRYVDWDGLSTTPELNENFIEKYIKKINWSQISQYQILSEKFIEKHHDKVNWYKISSYQKLSEEFIDKHDNKVDWQEISSCQKLSEKFIEKYQDKVDWLKISEHQKLGEEFIQKHGLFFHWYGIWKYQKISENYIEKHKYIVKWDDISQYQNLSEKFIMDHKYDVNWRNISQYQKLSDDFICNNIFLLDKNAIVKNYSVSYKWKQPNYVDAIINNSLTQINNKNCDQIS